LTMKENSIFHDRLRFGKFRGERRGARNKLDGSGSLRNPNCVVSFCPMKNSALLTLTICFLFSPVFAQTKTKKVAAKVAAPASTNPFQEADKLFTFGEEPARDKQSMDVIERALAANENDYQWLWRAARVYYYVGDEADKSEKLPFFEKGINAGTRAVAAQPEAVEGHFWLGANYGGCREKKGRVQRLAPGPKNSPPAQTPLRV